MICMPHDAKHSFLVPRTGLEPVRPIGHQILSLTCLPIPPPWHKKGMFDRCDS